MATPPTASAKTGAPSRARPPRSFSSALQKARAASPATTPTATKRRRAPAVWPTARELPEKRAPHGSGTERESGRKRTPIACDTPQDANDVTAGAANAASESGLRRSASKENTTPANGASSMAPRAAPMADGASIARKRSGAERERRPLAAAPIWSAAASLPTDPPHSTVSAVPAMIAGASSGGTGRPSRTASRKNQGQSPDTPHRSKAPPPAAAKQAAVAPQTGRRPHLRQR